MLLTNKIPFRYECELQLEETTLYPDFTLRHPLTGQVFYWEHFGMMDNPNYCRNATTKLQLYFSHGIIPLNFELPKSGQYCIWLFLVGHIQKLLS